MMVKILDEEVEKSGVEGDVIMNEVKGIVNMSLKYY